MRALRNFVILVCELVIFALLVIFAVENVRAVQYRFIGNTFTGNVWWTVAGAALLGFLFALLMLGPGTLSARWRSRNLYRAHGRMEQQLTDLQTEHERLQAEHANVLNERDRLQRSLTAMSEPSAATAGAGAGAGAATTRYAPTSPIGAQTDGATRTETRTETRTDGAVQTTAPATPADADETNEPVAPEEGGWRGTLRRLREGRGSAPDEMEPMDTPQENPPAPTA